MGGQALSKANRTAITYLYEGMNRLNLVYRVLVLRDAVAQDAEQLCRWWNDGAVMAHAGFPLGLHETVQRVRESLAKDSEENGRRQIIECAGVPIGEMNYRRVEENTAEIGIKICEEAAQGKGNGTILLSIFIDALFRYYAYDKVILDTNLNNTRAQHVYEAKLRMRRVGVRRDCWRDQLGALQSAVDYLIEKDAWVAAHPTLPDYLRLRLERPEEYHAVEELTREAFWINTDAGQIVDEHFLVYKLRRSACFIPELDYVAERQGRVVGSIFYSRGKVVSEEGSEHPLITFGPISVLPESKLHGVGSALMTFSIAQARRLGYVAIAFHGHPDYYPRFGFRPAREFGLCSANGKASDAFMAMELTPGGLRGITGRFYEDPLFSNMTPEEVSDYDRRFPVKAALPMILLHRLK